MSGAYALLEISCMLRLLAISFKILLSRVVHPQTHTHVAMVLTTLSDKWSIAGDSIQSPGQPNDVDLRVHPQDVSVVIYPIFERYSRYNAVWLVG